jgi:uncharacterized BrkB/YihY/UPF0761 family membrane protein
MSLDKKDKPLGLKITNFIVSNIFWYLVFSLIYLNLDPTKWWLIQSVWGRVVLILIELIVYGRSFSDDRKS